MINFRKFFLFFFFLFTKKIFNIFSQNQIDSIELNQLIDVKNSSEKYRFKIFENLAIDKKKIKSILDFGSGFGLDFQVMANNFPNCTIYSYDIDKNSQIYAKRINEIIYKKKVIFLDYNQLSAMLIRKSFDLIFCNLSLIYLNEKHLKQIISKFIKSKPKLILVHELSSHQEENYTRSIFNKNNQFYYLHNFKKIFKSLNVKFTLVKSPKSGFPHTSFGYIFKIYL